jgi:hypothetical protein
MLTSMLWSWQRKPLYSRWRTGNKNSPVSWDTAPCSPLLCLLCASYWFLACRIIRPWKWRWRIPQKRLLILNVLHCVVSQKTGLFITTAVWTSNPMTVIHACKLQGMWVMEYPAEFSRQYWTTWLKVQQVKILNKKTVLFFNQPIHVPPKRFYIPLLPLVLLRLSIWRKKIYRFATMVY